MKEFSPPTFKHLCVFLVVFMAGAGYILWYEVAEEPSFSLNRLLDNAVSILILSTALTVTMVEGVMFAEAWIEERRKKIREEAREQAEKEILDANVQRLAKYLENHSPDSLKKFDLPRLRQILSTDEDS